MGKRYKKGNIGKSKKKTKHKEYMKREYQINRLIHTFGLMLKNLDENDKTAYNEMDKIRLEIKELLAIQSRCMHRESRKRRYVYNDQVMNFKGIYVSWKKRTLHLFLEIRYDFPIHIIPQLCNHYRIVKTGGETYNVFNKGW